MAVNDLLELPAADRARIAMTLLESLGSPGAELSAEAEEALIRERDEGAFILKDEFMRPIREAGYGKTEL